VSTFQRHYRPDFFRPPHGIGPTIRAVPPRDDREVIASSLKGRLLIASPAMADPNFDHTIVLMVEHNDDGALGLILNRPSEASVSEILPGWGVIAAEPDVVFLGGPVSPDSAIGLGLAAEPEGVDDADGFIAVQGGLGTVDLARDPDEIRPPVRLARVFAGYSGWAGGQLEGELQAGGWFIADGGVEDALAGAPDQLWRAVLKRQRGSLAWLANFPLDPATN
jgi:putative transcriptional regulator